MLEEVKEEMNSSVGDMDLDESFLPKLPKKVMSFLTQNTHHLSQRNINQKMSKSRMSISYFDLPSPSRLKKGKTKV